MVPAGHHVPDESPRMVQLQGHNIISSQVKRSSLEVQNHEEDFGCRITLKSLCRYGGNLSYTPSQLSELAQTHLKLDGR